MGNPKQDQRNPETTTTKERSVEEKEIPKGQKAMTMQDLERQKEKLKSNPEEDASDAIRRLKGSAEIASQNKGFVAINATLTSILRKLDALDVDISKLESTDDLRNAINKAQKEGKLEELTLSEKAAMDNIDRIGSEKGPTATAVKNNWSTIKEAAKEANKGWGSKYMGYWKKDPTSAAFFTAGGVLGIVGIVLVGKWAIEKAFASKAGEEKKGISKERVAMWTAIGLGVTSLVLGRETIKRIFADMGLDLFDIEEKLKKGEELTENEKKKLADGKKKVQERVDEERRKRSGGTEPAPAEADDDREPTDTGALETKDDTESPESLENPKKLEAFGAELLITESAHKLDDGTYLYMTGDTETFFRFHEGKWQWASKTQKEEDKWVATGGNYYKEKEKFAKANEIARKLGEGSEIQREDEKSEQGNERLEEIEKMVSYEAPLELLIGIHCFNRIDIKDEDRLQIRNAVVTFRDRNVSEVMAVWGQYKDKEKIPTENPLGKFEDGIKEENVYMAIKIIALTAEEYKKRAAIDFSSVSVKDFLQQKISKDPVQKIHNTVQVSIIESIKKAGITDIFSFHDIDVSKVKETLAELSKEGWKELAKDYGIDIEKINKEDFVKILVFLKLHANLTMDWNRVVQLPNFPKSEDKATMDSMKLFYEKMRENTLNNIIPAAVKRFNLGKEFVNNKNHADIIKDNLNDNMTFENAVYLNIVTRNLDLAKSPEVGSSAPQEMTFLFTVLSTLAVEQKTRYMSELLNAITEYPEKFPSLKLIAPYLTMVADFACEYVENRVKIAHDWVSAMMPNRSEEDQRDFLQRMLKADAAAFTIGTAKEGSFGSLEVAWEILGPLYNSGKITLEEIEACKDDPWNFIMLIPKAGGSLLWYRDEKGNPHGMIHIAGDIFWYRPKGIVLETLDAALKGEGTDKVTGSLKVWTAGVMPFVTYGAIKGWYMAKWTAMGHLPLHKIGGAAKGAAEMYALYPYYALRTTSRAAKHTASVVLDIPKAVSEYKSRPGQALRKYGRGASDFVRYRSPLPGQNLPNMMENGKRFMHYYESSDFTKMGLRKGYKNLKTTEGRHLILRRLQRGFDTSMAIRYAKRFANTYNEFFIFDKGSLKKLFLADIIEGKATEITKTKEAFKRLQSFFEGSDNYGSAYKKMIGITKQGLSGNNLEDALFRVFKEDIGHLDDEEIRALVKQLNDEDDVLKLQRRVATGLEELRRGIELPAKNKSGAKSVEPDKAPDSDKPKTSVDDTPKNRGNGRYSYKEEEFKITQREIQKKQNELQNQRGGKKGKAGSKGRKDAPRVTKNEAIKAICEERWNTPKQISKSADGTRIFRFRSREISLTADECLNQAKVLASSEVKYNALIAAEEAGAGARAANAAEAAIPGRLESAKARVRRGGQHFMGETLHSQGGAEAVLKATDSRLAEWQPKIAEAEKIVQDITDARAAGRDLGDAVKAEEQLANARRVLALKAELEATTEAVKAVKAMEDAVKAAQSAKDLAKVAELQKELRAGTLAAEKALKNSGKAMEAVSRFGRVGTAFKTGFRFAGGGLAVFGAGISAYSAVSSFGEAWSTDVEGRKGVKYGESAMWAGSAVIDTLAVAGMVGAEGTAVGAGSALAAPLAPIVYAGSKVFETLNEDTKTSAEWIQEDPYQLLQNFYTSLNSCALGDAWLSVGAPEWRIEKQKITMRRIFRALIALQKDNGEPPLLNYIHDPQIDQDEKDRMIEERIKTNYSRYHEFYFNEAMVSGIQSYGDAQRFVLEAQIFDDIMQKRDEARKAGKPFMLVANDGTYFNLHLPRYDITEDGKLGSIAKQFNPSEVVQAYKQSMVKLFESDPIKKMNLDRMDNGYLLMMFMQIVATLNDPDMKTQLEADAGLAEDLGQQAFNIKTYLETARNLNMKFAGEYSKPEPRWSLEEIKAHLDGIGSATNKAFIDYEKREYKMTPAINAMYKLAEYFGYAGPPTEPKLKEFFSEKSASYHGIYWDGAEWMLQERGSEFDDSFGSELNSIMIEKLIISMRENPDDILEHRNDAIFMDAHDYKDEVMNMAKVLEDGLAGGVRLGYESGRKESEIERGAHVEYAQPKENLTHNYKESIEYVVGKTNWKNLDYVINDENSITLKRKDGEATIELTRSGEAWKVGEGYRDGLTLMQAVTLGNLLNWAKQWVKKEKIEGASERPFEIEDGRIDFDTNWNPVDKTFLKNWIGFYDEIGISKEIAVETLNNWYFNDVRKRTIDVGFFE